MCGVAGLQGKDVFSNVFIKNLPAEVGDDELMKMAAEHGEVTSAVVMKASGLAGPWHDN